MQYELGHVHLQYRKQPHQTTLPSLLVEIGHEDTQKYTDQHTEDHAEISVRGAMLGLLRTASNLRRLLPALHRWDPRPGKLKDVGHNKKSPVFLDMNRDSVIIYILLISKP